MSASLSDLLGGSESSDLPSWIKEHKSPAKKGIEGEVTSPQKNKKNNKQAAGQATRVHILASSSSSSSDEDLPLATMATTKGTKAASKPAVKPGAASEKLKKEDFGADTVDLITPTGTQQTANTQDDEDDDDLLAMPLTQQTEEEEGEDEDEEPLTQPTQLTQESAGKATASIKVGSKQGGAGGGAAKDVVLMVPEKVLTTKVLLQFDKNSEGLDLSGDVGAVGRFLVNQKQQQQQQQPKLKSEEASHQSPTEQPTLEDQVEIRMDLKGQIYSCR